MKTLGGRQFWGDVLFFHDWKIQKHTVTGHYRLLDGSDYRHASGTLETCNAKLAEVRAERDLSDMTGKAVIVVHGITRSSKSFGKMRQRLEQEGFTVFGFDYPSTRVGIAHSAEHLQQAIASLTGIEEIHFVVHSMGGLIVRAYLGAERDAARTRDPRIKSMVMLAVPNHGARMADKLKNNPLFKLIFGPAGGQMASDESGVTHNLPIPDFDFAIVAGARGTIKGYNPLVPGDDDGTVSVSSTRLPGAADFMTVQALHSFLMGNEDVIDSTVRFLKTGSLREDGERHPVPQSESPQ